jgi:putative tryptophan/tyrosine transport system substrate-binding protein
VAIKLRRREFMVALGGTAISPRSARAQRPATLPVVGFLYSGDPDTDADLAAAFRTGLGEAGYIEGQNVAIEYRWAHHDNAKLPGLIDDLIRRRVIVIAATGNSALRAAAAHRDIPIVFAIGFDPVEAGIVASLARPGANITGITSLNGVIGTKWLGLFHDLLPSATRFAVLTNPDDRIEDSLAEKIRAVAAANGWQTETLAATSNGEIDTAFAGLVRQRAEALMIAPGAFFRQRLVKLATLAARHAIPAIYPLPQFAEVGGLMSYGTSFVDLFRQAGIYVGRILKGAKPAELPVLQPTKFDFVINLSTAKAFDLTIPPGLLAIVDRVIE